MKAGLVVLAIVFSLVFCAWAGVRFVQGIRFDQNCEGYLKRAADANTIELAMSNLHQALSYIEENGLTTGYTSVFYRTPDEDVGFWYQNLKASMMELRAVNPAAAQLEKSNVLMKLRETLIDNQQKGVVVTAPVGISVFPHNTVYTIWALVSGFLTLLIWFMAFIADPY